MGSEPLSLRDSIGLRPRQPPTSPRMPTPPPSAAAHLTRLHADARAVGDAVEAALAGLEPAAWHRAPAPGRWSPAEIVEHLAVIGEAYFPGIRAALAEGAEPGRAAPGADDRWRPSLLGRLFIWLSGPARPVRVRAPAPFRPRPAALPLLERFRATQATLLALIEGSAFADLQRLRVRSPANRLLSLSLGECLTMLVRHEERHLAQLHMTVAALRDAAPARGAGKGGDE